MKCSKCGNELPRGAKFCGTCGQTVEAPIEGKEKEATEKRLPKNKMIPLLLVVAAVVIMVIICLTSKSSTIQLADYVVVSEKGYNGYGNVEFEIDWAKVVKEHGDDITFTEEGQTTYRLRNKESAMEEFIKVHLVSGKDGDLTNGDQVSYEIEVEEAFWEYAVCDLEYAGEFIFQMTKLKDIKKYDVFEKLKVEFTGISGQGTVNLIYNGEIDGASYYFSCDKSEELTNGDKIVVSLSEEDVEQFKRYYGVDPTLLKKDYYVQGLSEYIVKSTQLSEESFAKMKEDAEMEFEEEREIGWDEDVQSILNKEYIGCYLMKRKDSVEDSYEKNKIYLVYKVETRTTVDGKSKDLTYYWYAEFSDICADTNGKVEESVLSEVCGPDSDEDLVEVKMEVGDDDPLTKQYIGFETLEKLKVSIYDSEAQEEYYMVEYPKVS